MAKPSLTLHPAPDAMKGIPELTVPAAQLVHDDWPVEEAYVPAPQTSQVEANDALIVTE